MKKTIRIRQVEAMELIPYPGNEGEMLEGAALVLREIFGKRRINLPLNRNEAKSILLTIRKLASGSLFEDSITKNILNHLGAELKRLIITEIGDGMYRGFVIFGVEGEDIPINSKPFSVAIAIGLKKPIYVSEELLDKHGETGPEQDENVFQFLFKIKDD